MQHGNVFLLCVREREREGEEADTRFNRRYTRTTITVKTRGIRKRGRGKKTRGRRKRARQGGEKKKKEKNRGGWWMGWVGVRRINFPRG